MSLVNPTIESIILKIPTDLTIILAITLGIVIMTDFIISVIAVYNIKLDIKIYNKQDATEIIKKEVSEALKQHQFLIIRLFKAFPNITQRKNINFNNYKELVIKTKEEINRLKLEHKNNKKVNKNRK